MNSERRQHQHARALGDSAEVDRESSASPPRQSASSCPCSEGKVEVSEPAPAASETATVST